MTRPAMRTGPVRNSYNTCSALSGNTRREVPTVDYAIVELACARRLFNIAIGATTRTVLHMDGEFICPTPGCETIVRKHVGLHASGEPMVWIDAQGQFVRCPSCHARIAWPPVPDPDPDSDPVPDLPTAA